MNKIVKIILIAITSLLCLLLLSKFVVLTYDFTSELKMQKIKYKLSSDEYKMIEDGDIILRHGYGFVSDMIVKNLEEELAISHCAIVVKNDSVFNVIHSVSQAVTDLDGVQQQDIRHFIHESKQNSVIVLRYKYLDGQAGDMISQRAYYYLNQKVPFDLSFNIEDTTRYFCTELIWKVMLDVFNVDIFDSKYGLNQKEFLKFDVFFDPERFEVVFSHH
jgi:hypothetical protein